MLEYLVIQYLRLSLHQQRKTDMKIFTSESGNKRATIVINQNDGYYVKLVQLINTGIGMEEDLIQMKSFITEKSAEKWALKNL